MSFDKRYPHRKDWRAPYRDSRRFSAGCRHGGGCKVCEADRLYQDRRDRAAADAQLEEPYYSHPCEDGTCPSCYPGVASFDPEPWPFADEPIGHAMRARSR